MIKQHKMELFSFNYVNEADVFQKIQIFSKTVGFPENCYITIVKGNLIIFKTSHNTRKSVEKYPRYELI